MPRAGGCRETGVEWAFRHRDLWLALVLAVMAFRIVLPRFVVPERLGGDQWGYFCYLPALFDHRPFDLRELAAACPELAHRPPLGRTVNLFGVGPALLWLPWYAYGRALYPHIPVDSVTMREICGIGTVVIGLVGMLFLFGALVTVLPRWAAAAASLAAILCASLLAYMTLDPLMSHVHSFALASLLLWIALTRDLKRWPAWAGMGIVCGLLAATRPQLVTFAVLPFIIRRPGLRATAAFAAAFLIGAAPQMIYWRMTFGSWLVNPQVAVYGAFFSRWAIWEVLWSPRHGLFLWHPLLLLGVAGLIAACQRPHLRALAVAALVVFATQVAVNSLPWDWWASNAFGARRFCGTIPLLALGIGFAVARVPALIAAVVAAGWWNLGLLWAYNMTIPAPVRCILGPERPLTLDIARNIARVLVAPITDVFFSPAVRELGFVAGAMLGMLAAAGVAAVVVHALFRRFARG